MLQPSTSLPGSPFINRRASRGSHQFQWRNANGRRFGDRKPLVLQTYLDAQEHLPYADDSAAVTPMSEENGAIIVPVYTNLGSRHNSYTSHTSRISYTSHGDLLNGKPPTKESQLRSRRGPAASLMNEVLPSPTLAPLCPHHHHHPSPLTHSLLPLLYPHLPIYLYTSVSTQSSPSVTCSFSPCLTLGPRFLLTLFGTGPPARPHPSSTLLLPSVPLTCPFFIPTVHPLHPPPQPLITFIPSHTKSPPPPLLVSSLIPFVYLCFLLYFYSFPSLPPIPHSLFQ